MKRIVVLNVDGTERVLDKAPTSQEMKAIVGGYIEHTRVMDRLDDRGQIVFTSMFVNETGLLDDLPRNHKATEIYQRNIRHQFAGEANPFRAATEKWHQEIMKRFGGNVTFQDVTPPSAIVRGYKEDPWIAGPAIYFEGYTVEEVDEFFS